jgi:peptidoglycan/LPS O-acetylase OafA/YrhL
VGAEIFFVISGFLVTRSWIGDPSFRRYIGKRARRIFPGLICAVLVTAFVFGPIFSSSSPAAFLGSSAPLTYVISNVSLFPHYVLATVFASNPDHVANGSLWTLPVEVRAYILLGLLSLGLLRRNAIGAAAMGLFAILFVVTFANIGWFAGFASWRLVERPILHRRRKAPAWLNQDRASELGRQPLSTNGHVYSAIAQAPCAAPGFRALNKRPSSRIPNRVCERRGDSRPRRSTYRRFGPRSPSARRG